MDRARGVGHLATQVIGYGSGTPTGGVQNGLLLADATNQVYRLLPSPGYIRSTANATSARRQVGSAVTFPGRVHARDALGLESRGERRGDAAVRQPASGGLHGFGGLGVGGNQQVGTAEPSSFVPHAWLWTGGRELRGPEPDGVHRLVRARRTGASRSATVGPGHRRQAPRNAVERLGGQLRGSPSGRV